MPESPYRRISVIFNPRAGRLLRNPRLLEDAINVLRRGGAEVKLTPTYGPATAGAIAREQIVAGSDLILVAGGDGTMNETLGGVAGSSVPLGMLPVGTANVLAMELGLGKSLDKVAASVPQLVPQRIALGILRSQDYPGGRHFLLMTGAGLDAGIVNRLRPGLKDATGKFAYWVSGFSMIPRMLEQLDAVSEGIGRRAGFALISRVRNYGGDLEIARSVTLAQDNFEVVLFKGRPALVYGFYFLGVIARVHRHLPGVTVLRTKRIELRPAGPRDVFLQVDGELAGKLPATVEIVPDAVTLLMPSAYLSKSG